ncbi:hypothetical protein [Priestia koreensis]|uniref:hypothetical protein n=1 Tax=Priestia koreensis TaxID=284581 RepID=UPI001F59C7CD|nr:hypothetical protein [Priestia koreensis]UNL86972.1 hypothetical protein IE339_10990 [Priestia koreensis]
MNKRMKYTRYFIAFLILSGGRTSVSFVAAGSVVIKDVPSNVLVAGNLGKKLRDI